MEEWRALKVYREVLCPDCGKKYMTYYFDDDEYDVIIKQGEGFLYGWRSSCPKCQNDLFVEHNVLEATRMDKYPEESISIRSVMR